MVINKDKEERKEVILAKVYVCPSNSHISVAYVKMFVSGLLYSWLSREEVTNDRGGGSGGEHGSVNMPWLLAVCYPRDALDLPCLI